MDAARRGVAREVQLGKALVALLAVLTAAALWLVLQSDTAPVGPASSTALPVTPDAAPRSRDAPTPRAVSRETQPLALPASAAHAADDDASRWPPGFETLTLSGRVLDEFGRPVPRAELRLLPESRALRELGLRLWGHVGGAEVVALEREQLESTLTDAAGRFHFEAPWRPDGGDRPGTDARVFPQLLVLAPGYAAHSFACLGYAGGAFDAGDLVLEQPGAELVVRLVDPDGAPVVGAQLSVNDKWRHAAPLHPRYPPQCMPVFRFRSDAAGRLRVPYLWTGRQALSFVHPHFDPAFERVKLDAGERLDLGTLVMDPLGVVRGRVLDARGQPVVGAEVSTSVERWEFVGPNRAESLRSLQDGDALSGVALTDAHGAFQLGGLDPKRGPYTLIAAAPGVGLGALDDVPAGSVGQVLQLVPEATLRVRAVDALDGRAVDDVELIAVANRDTASTARVDALSSARWIEVDGALLRGVGPAGTRLFASAPGYSQGWYEAPGVPPGESAELELRMQRARPMSVRVVDERGEAVPGARLELSHQIQRRGNSAGLAARVEGVSDSSGRAEFAGLAEQRWHMQVSAPGYLPRARDLLVSAETREDVVELKRAARLSGRVLRAPDVPAVGLHVEWRVNPYQSEHQVTDVRGRFRFELWPGSGELRVPRLPARTLELRAGESRELELVQREPFVLTGLVLAGGRPMPGVDVGLGEWLDGREQESEPRWTLSDDAGRFRFVVEQLGEHRLTAWWAGASVDRVVHPRLGEHDDVLLDFGSASLAGFVVAGDSRVPLSGLTLTLRTQGLRLEPRPVAPDGSFRFDPIPPGNYDIFIAGNGCIGERWGPYELSDGAALEGLQLSPQLGASVTGRALRADGGPFRGAVHLRSADRAHYEVARADYREGRFEFHGLAPGRWQLDLAETSRRELGDGAPGVDGIGEPGVELPFYAQQIVTLDAGEAREVVLAVGQAAPP